MRQQKPTTLFRILGLCAFLLVPFVLGLPRLGAAPAIDAGEVLPAAVERRMLTYLEERRRIEESGWFDASIVGATPMYRPGSAEPAYWEFELRDGRGAPAGYAVVSTAEHDFPIAESAERGRAPSRALRDDARAKGASIVRFYLPAPAFPVAETADGEMIAGPRGLPPKIVGWDPAWLDMPPAVFEGQARLVDGELVEDRPEVETDLRQQTWDSWNDLRLSYAEIYAVPNALRRRQAAADWATERQLAEHGEALEQGNVRYIPLLARGEAEFNVAGPGHALVSVTRVERGATDRALRLEVTGATDVGPTALKIHVDYADGTRESLPYVATATLPAPPIATLAATGVAPCSGRSILLTMSGAVVDPQARGGSIVLEGRLDAPWVAGDTERAGGRDGWSWRGVTFESAGVGVVLVKARDGKYWRVVDDKVQADAARSEASKFELQQRRAHRIPRCFGSKRKDCTSQLWAPVIGLKAVGSGNVHVKDGVRVKKRKAAQPLFALCEPRTDHTRTYWAHGSSAEAARYSPRYDQIPARTGPNTGKCSSGSGPTAWGILIGGVDQRAWDGDATWAPHGKLVTDLAKKGNSDIRAPKASVSWRRRGGRRNATADALLWQLNTLTTDVVTRDCRGESLSKRTNYWTHPGAMSRASAFFKGRAKVSLTTKWDGVGNSTTQGLRELRDIIKIRKRPAIIGEGPGLNHYSVALGITETEHWIYNKGTWKWKAVTKTRFEVNRGWGDRFTHQVPYLTWFQGWLHPRAGGWDTVDARDSGARCSSAIACVTGRCDMAINKCIPNDAQGRAGEYCNTNAQCAGGSCVDEACAERASPSGEKTGS